jgi:hypothetical protein
MAAARYVPVKPALEPQKTQILWKEFIQTPGNYAGWTRQGYCVHEFAL